MKRILSLIVMLVMMTAAHAQQAYTNTAFKGGEDLQYNLYFNWQFVWVKVGSAQMSTTEKTLAGTPAYRCSLITRGNQRADKLFVMRDTLLSYTTTKLVPLYYRKGAKEGKRYYVDEFLYKYNNGKVNLTQKVLTSSGEHITKQKTSSQNIYDMLSIFMRARSYSSAGWEKGHMLSFPLADGDGTKTAILKYRGTSNVKAEDGHKYRCLELSYLENENGKQKEIVRFYVTDDKNHIPVRLDLNLKFGSAKAYLTSMKGIRNDITARIK